VDCPGKPTGAPGVAAELAVDMPDLSCAFARSPGARSVAWAWLAFLQFRLVLPAVGNLRPGAALGPDTHPLSPSGLAMTCRFMPCFLRLPE
jgi:hypothetical protein